MAGEEKREIRLQGIAASPGVAWGKLFLWNQEEVAIPTHRLPDDQIEQELAVFHRALTTTGEQLEGIKKQVEEEMGGEQAAIFGAHLLVLQDPALVDEVERQINQGVNGAQAIEQVVEELAQMLADLDDEYLRERAADIRDVGRRVLHNFLGVRTTNFADLREPVLMVAQDLTPSETAQLQPGVVLGFATVVGGRTSHVAIMARTREIPAVVGVGQELLHSGDATIIVDGTAGEIVINPSKETVELYRQKKVEYAQHRQHLMGLRDLLAQTKDGHRVELAANIGTPQDVERVLAYGAEGVGLFRTEFLYMDRSNPPTEEEQFQAYKGVVERLAPYPVIIRTLDVGGDKEIPYLKMPPEQNPFLGWRAIRYCLEREEIFRPQLAAILRASAFGQVKIMFPMITTGDEIRRAKAILDQVKEELTQRGEAYADQVEVGIMVETPAAAVAADLLAREVDFFSIGTNDLAQYTLAVDRGNEQVSHLYDPFHPAVLRLIKQVIDAGHGAGRWVGMCGEMAGQPLATPLLLGLGLDEFSMDAGQVPVVKEVVRALSWRDTRQMATHALGLASGQEVAAFTQRTVDNLKLPRG